MRKRELVQEIHDRTGYTKLTVQEITDAMLGCIASELCAGNSVNLGRFGLFKTARRRSDNTRKPVFVAGRVLKMLVEENENGNQSIHFTE